MMKTPLRLGLTSSDGSPLCHAYHMQEHGAKGLAVLLPGQHYGMDGPLLYYPKRWLWRAGWDTFSVTYGLQARMEELSAASFSSALEECRRALDLLLRQRPYPGLALIGKSMGCVIAIHLMQSSDVPPPTRLILLSPPLNMPMFADLAEGLRPPAYMAAGTADRYYEPGLVTRLRQEGHVMECVEGGDHHLEVDANLEKSLAALKRVTEGVLTFLTG
jgi:predicted alpha/beta-fold hydrolase